MRSRDFVFWLQGFFEISGTKNVTPEQIGNIRKHLNLVFKHEIDPSMGDENHQKELNKIHNEYVGKFPETDAEAEAKWGPKPSPEHKFSVHGWYHPKEGIPRC